MWLIFFTKNWSPLHIGVPIFNIEVERDIVWTYCICFFSRPETGNEVNPQGCIAGQLLASLFVCRSDFYWRHSEVFHVITLRKNRHRWQSLEATPKWDLFFKLSKFEFFFDIFLICSFCTFGFHLFFISITNIWHVYTSLFFQHFSKFQQFCDFCGWFFPLIIHKWKGNQSVKIQDFKWNLLMTGNSKDENVRNEVPS